MYKRANNDQPFNDKKIVGIIAVLVLLGLLVVLMTNVTSSVLTGARAFVYGEGLWSKSQKEATLHLVRYIQEEREEYYAQFTETVKVNEAYDTIRGELNKNNPDYEKVKRAIKKGRGNVEDTRDVMWIYENLQWTSYMQSADSLWARGMAVMNDLTTLAENIHQQINRGSLSTQEKERYIQQVYKLDNTLTEIVNDFSQTISRSTIYVSSIVYWATICMGLLLLLSGGFVTVRFMRNAKKWGESIAASEQNFRDVLENTQDVIYRLDRQKGEYIYMSPSVEEMLGFNVEEVLRQGPEFIYSRIHPDDLERLETELNEAQNKRSMQDYSQETEFRVKTKGGNYIWVSNKRSVIFDEQGNATDIVGSVRDISERKEYEHKIDQSLTEKNILLQEIHHRVKNNLAMISGLLYLQKEEVAGEAKTALETAKSRIDSVAMIHEKLYGSDSLSDINLAEYIDELTDAIGKAYESEERKIRLEKNLNPVTIEIVNAVTFGLIINELVHNAYKHAFSKGETGIIRLSLEEQGECKVFSIADTGKGLPEDFDIKDETSLGMTLINSLCDQLGAKIDIQSNTKGTTIKIIFT